MQTIQSLQDEIAELQAVIKLKNSIIEDLEFELQTIKESSYVYDFDGDKRYGSTYIKTLFANHSISVK